MIGKQLLHLGAIEILTYQGIVPQSSLQLSRGTSKPIIYNIDGKASLPSLQYFWGEEVSADLPMEPLPSSISNLERRVQSLHILNYLSIQIGYPDL